MKRSPYLNILQQPTDTTCGHTCLHAIYEHHGLAFPLERIIADVGELEGGGSLGVMLANHALKHGFSASILTHNLYVFDPTWDYGKPKDIIEKLKQRRKEKKSSKMALAIGHYIKYLQSGGKLHFRELNKSTIRGHLEAGMPILTGLSATYLYNCARERVDEKGASIYDDVNGDPVGHFVLLCSMADTGRVLVADPYQKNPVSGDHFYTVGFQRLINAILLGVITYDANLIVIRPKA